MSEWTLSCSVGPRSPSLARSSSGIPTQFVRALYSTVSMSPPPTRSSSPSSTAPPDVPGCRSRSLPPPPCSLSLPAWPLITSPPSPPLSTFASEVPWRMSSPDPPVTFSTPPSQSFSPAGIAVVGDVVAGGDGDARGAPLVGDEVDPGRAGEAVAARSGSGPEASCRRRRRRRTGSSPRRRRAGRCPGRPRGSRRRPGPRGRRARPRRAGRRRRRRRAGGWSRRRRPGSRFPGRR